MRVQLFNPPVHHYGGVRFRLNPPLGLPILAAVLRAAGHTAEVADLEALGVSPARLADVFARQRDRWPDVVGFTALTASARGARESVQALRGAGYTGRIVVGGVHATLYPDEPLQWGADLVVTGECEGNIVALLEQGAAGVQAGEAAPIERIPAPAWDVHQPGPQTYYGNAPHLTDPQGISMWSRGCPGACVFCGNTIFRHQRSRYRPPEAIAAELADLKARGIRSVFVYDDELPGAPHLAPAWLGEVADRIAPLGLQWKCQGRCSRRHITPALLGDLARGGCKVVMWGVESFSPRVLRAIRKATHPDDIWHSLRAAKAAGIKNWLFIMVGSPEEGEDEAAETAAALEAAYAEGLVDYSQVTVVTALPGTALWARQQREGWWAAPPEAGPQMHQVYAPTPWLSARRIAYWVALLRQVCPVNEQGRIA